MAKWNKEHQKSVDAFNALAKELEQEVGNTFPDSVFHYEVKKDEWGRPLFQIALQKGNEVYVGRQITYNFLEENNGLGMDWTQFSKLVRQVFDKQCAEFELKTI